MEDWKMTIQLEARNFEALKFVAAYVFEQINAAKTYKNLPIMGAGGSGQCGNDFSFSVEYSCPVEQRIANLRSEADALEASLANGFANE